jgi:hypothetical protein
MENQLDFFKNVLVLYGCEKVKDFFGIVTTEQPEIWEKDKNYYLLGPNVPTLEPMPNVFIVQDEKQLPKNVHHVGVYIEKFFQTSDYFHRIVQEHAFQNLTESNKPGKSHRKGIYLTRVDNQNEFHLLRCSTNLDGPTEGFSPTDEEIVSRVNEIAKSIFVQPVDLNHVLAQVYQNQLNENNKPKKAVIKAHSDKTKDMPRDGAMAFVTFYDRESIPKNGETRLRFKSKVENLQFDVLLHPGSVFFITLETNRLFTHEIVPSILPIDKLPTRMGYVIRCSKTKARFVDGKTDIFTSDQWEPLQPITDQDIALLRELYYKENVTTEMVEYGHMKFSMNLGDYQCPLRK